MPVKKPLDVIAAIEAWEERHLGPSSAAPGSSVCRTLLESGVGWVVSLGQMGAIKAIGYGTTAAEAFGIAKKKAEMMFPLPGRRKKRSA